MVASSLACADGNGIWMRWVASRLSRATTASRSAPRPGWGSVFAASTTSLWLAADAFIHPWLHSFAKRDQSRTRLDAKTQPALVWLRRTYRCGLAESVK